MRLENKTVVITGAASGMGLAMATRFAAEGGRIVAGDWNVERLDPVGAKPASEYAALIPAHLVPEDIAALALFLASDESRQINGALIAADGGWAAA